MKLNCRHCSKLLSHEVINLGYHPPSNNYLTAEQLLLPELTLPLRAYVCTNCWLVQLPVEASAEDLFTDTYAYFSSISTTWCEHAERFVAEAAKKLQLNEHSLVVELASNDGYLLQYVLKRGIPCLGIEPTRSTSEVARARGIKTIETFFSKSLAIELTLQDGAVSGGADLVIANNVLAHVPDVNDFVSGISILLKPGGLASIEFPHLLRLISDNQFDTIYHEHYSYLSLSVVRRIAHAFGLMVADVEELSTHGGSLRVWLAHQGTRKQSEAVNMIISNEISYGLESLLVYSDFQQRAKLVKHSLLDFLLKSSSSGQLVLGYGAAAKGNTLLNYAGVRPDLLPAVADLSSSKQGLFLPGSHIPIITPLQLKEFSPDQIIVFPWNLISEVRAQLKEFKLVTFIPYLQHWN